MESNGHYPIARQTVGILLAGLFLFLNTSRLNAASAEVGEYDVKAAYLYNFAKFVEWPTTPPVSGSKPDFCIGIVGEDPFGSGLGEILTGKLIQDKPLTVRHWHNAAEATACQIVFISDSESAHLDQILSVLSASPVLTVGNNPAFVAKGGMIGFLIVHNTVRFDVNLTAAQNARLQISSQLLKVAHSVQGTTAGGAL